MEGLLDTFLLELVNDVPPYIYEMLIAVTCLSIIIFFASFKWKKALRFSLLLLFIEYLFLIYCSTVFCRSRIDDIGHFFMPFWSYKAYESGKYPSLLPEILMNIIGFIPLGFLMRAAFHKLKWWQVILTGFLVSVSIETLQYIFNLGFAEFDDVFNNTLGVAIGYSLYAITYFILNKIIRISI